MNSPVGIPNTTNPVQSPNPPSNPPPTPPAQNQQTNTITQQSVVGLTPNSSITSIMANPKVNPEISEVLSKIQDMTRYISDPNQRASFIKALGQQLNMIGNSSKCVCIHALFPDLKYEEKDYHLQQIEDLYRKAREKPVHNIYKSLSAICPPCLYLKMGLLSTDVVKDFKDSFCSNKTGPHKTYNLGPMAHVLTSYNVNQKVYPNMQNAMNISFHPGNILIPDSKIFLQMLAMPSNLIDQGVKVIWVDTEETVPCNNNNIKDQLECYEKFMNALPASLDNGYYKGEPKPIDKIKLITSPPHKFVKAAKGEENLVLLKIFDVNSVLNIYYSQLIQSQRRLQVKTITDNDGSRLYLNRTNFACYEPLSTHRIHDFLAIAVALSNNPEDLKKYPPLNNECITTPHNILIINNKGKAVFTDSTEPKSTTACEKLKRGLKDGTKYPPHKRFVNTAHTMTPNTNLKPGDPIKPDSFPDLNTTTSPDLADIAMEKHINDSEMFRKNLKANIDNLKNYFSEFNDDLNKPVDINNVNYSIFDIAIGMSPSKILDINHNLAGEKPNGIDIFSDYPENGTNILEIASPNVVYSDQIGFVTLKSLCSNEMLVLKNTIAHLQNIMNRSVGVFRKFEVTPGNNITTLQPNYLVQIRDPSEYLQVVDKTIKADTSIPNFQIEPPNDVHHIPQDLCDSMSFNQYVNLYTPPKTQGCIW